MQALVGVCFLFVHLVIVLALLTNNIYLQLYVWDESHYIPLLVKNRAAEMLFGNIKAEKVYASYKRECTQNANAVGCSKNHYYLNPCTSHFLKHRKANSHKQKHHVNIGPNYHAILLLLLKMLFKQGRNSPLNFTVLVNSAKDWESGRLEVMFVSMSSFRTEGSPLAF